MEWNGMEWNGMGGDNMTEKDTYNISEDDTGVVIDLRIQSIHKCRIHI